LERQGWLAAAAVVVGANIWVFGLQAPLLLKSMGRARFVPLQMQVTRKLLEVLVILLAVQLLATLAKRLAPTLALAAALLAFAAAAIVRFVLLPRAFRAAGRQKVADAKTSPSPGEEAFFAEGLGEETKAMYLMIEGRIGPIMISCLANLWFLCNPS
jgi:hypothetical protein